MKGTMKGINFHTFHSNCPPFYCFSALIQSKFNVEEEKCTQFHHTFHYLSLTFHSITSSRIDMLSACFQHFAHQ